MGGISAALVGLAAWIGGLAAAPAVTPERFQEWFEAGLNGERTLPDGVAGRAARFRYLFVGGFAGESMPGYFAQNIRELRALGVPAEAVHALFPSSDNATAANVAAIGVELRRLAALGPEPLVVIAHSRGACEVLAAALRDPALVASRISALFLVQGAFGGTAVADYVLGEGESIDRRMPRPARGVANLLARLERSLLARGRHDGLNDLTRSASKTYWEKTLAEHPGSVRLVRSRTFFLCARVHPSRLRLFRKAPGWYLHTYYGANDGIVAVEDQLVPGLGTCLGTFDLGHSDLTNRFPAGRASRRYRRALVQGVVLAVAEAAPPVRPLVDEAVETASVGERPRPRSRGRRR